MKKYCLYLTIVLLVSCQSRNTEEFIITGKSSNTTIYIDANADNLVKWAANDLSKDLEMILERKITINYTDKFHPEHKGI